jgi:hypothetical protein
LNSKALAAVESAANLSVQRLASQAHADGHYEGFADAGVAFDAANLLLARFVGERWPEDPALVHEKMRHVLSGQHSCGLFLLYPGGPCSKQATRIVCLTIDCVQETTGAGFSPSFRDTLSAVRRTAEEALESPRCSTFDPMYLLFFRWILEALSENAPDIPRRLPNAKLAFLLPVMLGGLLPRSMWRRTDRIIYPFIAVLPRLLSFSSWRAVETSHTGAELLLKRRYLVPFVGSSVDKLTRSTSRWLLDTQDSTGGFYYSAMYTYLFVAALTNAVDVADSSELKALSNTAIRRALDYVRGRETVVATGVSTSFLASDIWDTTAVATSMLEAPDGWAAPGISLQPMGAYVLSEQAPSGGFSFGRGSHFPDVDSTGLVIGLFTVLLRRDREAANRDAMLNAVVRAFDFLEKHRSRKGGFNAWTIRHGETPPPMPSALTSLLFDVSSADVTARVMRSLGSFLELAHTDEGAARILGPERLRRAESLRKHGLQYLLSTRDATSGMWPARWTLGYIIGSRFVLDALETYPEMTGQLASIRDVAAETLLACQNADGGYGESADSDIKERFTPSSASAPLVTAAALGILRDASIPGAAQRASRALEYILRTQRPGGNWPEHSLCTQFPGLYASYELMTQVALTTTLFRVLRGEPGGKELSRQRRPPHH